MAHIKEDDMMLAFYLANPPYKNRSLANTNTNILETISDKIF